MASIKVTYGQTSRKFTIPSNTTWTEFESKLHDLFNIPNDITISLVYVDEDGDVITLSTDLELQQILSDQELFGTNVKFNVYTSENPDNDGWVLENAEEKDNDSVTTLSDDELKVSEHDETKSQEINQVEERQPLVETDYPHVTVTDEKDDPLFEQPASIERNSEKQQEELLIPVNSEIKQNQEPEEYSSTEKAADNDSSNTVANTEDNTEANTNENVSNNNNNTENDSTIIFIISSSPWIQRTYYRPRVSPFAGLLSYFGHFIRPRYSYITPRPSYRRLGCELTYNNNSYGLFI